MPVVDPLWPVSDRASRTNQSLAAQHVHLIAFDADNPWRKGLVREATH